MECLGPKAVAASARERTANTVYFCSSGCCCGLFFVSVPSAWPLLDGNAGSKPFCGRGSASRLDFASLLVPAPVPVPGSSVLMEPSPGNEDLEGDALSPPGCCCCCCCPAPLSLLCTPLSCCSAIASSDFILPPLPLSDRKTWGPPLRTALAGCTPLSDTTPSLLLSPSSTMPSIEGFAKPSFAAPPSGAPIPGILVLPIPLWVMRPTATLARLTPAMLGRPSPAKLLRPSPAMLMRPAPPMLMRGETFWSTSSRVRTDRHPHVCSLMRLLRNPSVVALDSCRAIHSSLGDCGTPLEAVSMAAACARACSWSLSSDMRDGGDHLRPPALPERGGEEGGEVLGSC
mmetsp:Transcript_8887/g.23982  ORF Transcript_8887/g.23982 Transcript_8887/m.23982 type:complete len:344 (-) Transcript_8887:2453-3484(-)